MKRKITLFEKLKNHSKTTLGLGVLSVLTGALAIGLPLVLISSWDLSPSILAVKITLITLGSALTLAGLASLAALFYWCFKGDIRFCEIEESSRYESSVGLNIEQLEIENDLSPIPASEILKEAYIVDKIIDKREPGRSEKENQAAGDNPFLVEAPGMENSGLR